MSKIEITARQEVEYETYILQTQIEGRVLNELVFSYILPVAFRYQQTLSDGILALKQVYGKDSDKAFESRLVILDQLNTHLNGARQKTEAMVQARREANLLEDPKEKAEAYCQTVKPFFEEIRHHCDRLERLIENGDWPLVKYRELLFYK